MYIQYIHIDEDILMNIYSISKLNIQTLSYILVYIGTELYQSYTKKLKKNKCISNTFQTCKSSISKKKTGLITSHQSPVFVFFFFKVLQPVSTSCYTRS